MHERFEIEQKYRISKPENLRRRLRALGARRFRTGLEHNEFFDWQGRLRRKRLALRLRRFGGSSGVLTLKGPRRRSRFTKRLELETKVHYDAARSILAQLGFRSWARYTKRREAYAIGQGVVTLDRIAGRGWFLEIEGRPRAIERLERNLGLRPLNREERSYMEMLFGYKD